MSAQTRNAAVWRIRPSGSATNGGGYDSTIAGAATDYSQQNAAQASGTNATCTTGGATFVDATANAFTSAMIGNAIYIASGTNFLAGYYFVTGYTSASTVTLDRDPTNGSNGSAGAWALGGGITWAQMRVMVDTGSTEKKCLPGNTFYIYGGGTDTPSANDYTQTSYQSVVSGNTTNGRVRFIGENGRPRIQGDGMLFYNTTLAHFENLYLIVTAAGFGTLGMISTANGGCTSVHNVVFNLNDKSSLYGIGNVSGPVTACEFTNGTTSPASTGQRAIDATGFVGGGSATGNYIHHIGGDGVVTGADSALVVENNIVYKCQGNGMTVTGTPSGKYPVRVFGNTFDSNLGDGLNIASGATLQNCTVVNNDFSNQNQASKYGISVAGTLANNNLLKGLVDYNNFYNNTVDRNGISAGANDTALNPTFTAASTGDFTIGTNLKAKGFPGQFRNATGSISYVDIGAVQRVEPTGGGGGLAANPTRGFMA